MSSNNGVVRKDTIGEDNRTLTERPDPGALSGPLAGVSFVAGLVGAITLADSPYPRPGSEPAEIRRYFRGNPRAARVSVVGQLISAASLARFTASVARMATGSDREARGLRAGAIAAGGLAAASLATSALLSAALTSSWGEQDARAADLHRLMFAVGGPVHSAGFGVLMGVLGRAGLRAGELAPIAGDSGIRLSSSGRVVAVLLRDGARGLVHSGWAVLGVVGQPHRWYPAQPPLELASTRRSVGAGTEVPVRRIT